MDKELLLILEGIDDVLLKTQYSGMNTAKLQTARDVLINLINDPDESQVCCLDFKNCDRPCTPRGEWMQIQKNKTFADMSKWQEIVVANLIRHGAMNKHLARGLALHFEELLSNTDETL